MDVLPILFKRFNCYFKTICTSPCCKCTWFNFFVNPHARAWQKTDNLPMVKSFVTVPPVSVPSLFLFIAKFIDQRKWCCSYTDLKIKQIICLWYKALIKIKQILIQVPSKTYCNNSSSIIAKFTLSKTIRKRLLFRKSIT